MSFNKSEKIAGVVLALIALLLSIDLLNYKSWILFLLGVAIIVASLILIIKVLQSFFKNKNKTQ